MIIIVTLHVLMCLLKNFFFLFFLCEHLSDDLFFLLFLLFLFVCFFSCFFVCFLAFAECVRQIRNYYKAEKAAQKKEKGGCVVI